MELSNKDIERKLEELEDQIRRLKTFIMENSVGNWDGWISEDCVYTESVQDKSTILSALSRVIEHVLKLKYSTTNWNYNQWLTSLHNAQQIIQDVCHYPDDPVTLYMKHLYDHINLAYSAGVSYYNMASNEYYDLKPNIGLIPKVCPWGVDALIISSPQELLNVLPDPVDMSTQMQLYPFCKYYNHKKDFAGHKCEECDRYSECVVEYAEERYGSNNQEYENPDETLDDKPNRRRKD